MKRAKLDSTPSGIALAEAAIALVRRTPLSTLAVYYIGSLPFIAGLLAFWSLIGAGPGARALLPATALLLAALFLWMKAWQARYAQELMAQVRDLPAAPWTVRGFLRTLSSQALPQATGFLLLPLSAFILLPFGPVYTFYQNLTVLDDGRYHSLRDLLRDAVHQARKAPRQYFQIIWLLSPFPLFFAALVYLGVLPVIETFSPLVLDVAIGLYAVFIALALLPISPFGIFLAINLGMGIGMVAFLLRVFFGIHTVFTAAPSAVDHAGLHAIICGLVYLLLDPVLKAAYVLRTFHSQSQSTGEDLRLRLRHAAVLRGAAVAALALLILGITGGHAHAANALPVSDHAASAGRDVKMAEMPLHAPNRNFTLRALDPAALEEAVARELESPRYAWRLPPELHMDTDNWLVRAHAWLQGHLEAALNQVGEWWQRFKDWLFGDDEAIPAERSPWQGLNLEGALRWLMVLLIVALIGALLLYAARIYQQRRQQPPETLASTAAPPPDLDDERTSADQLPEQGWLDLAQEMRAQGNYRLASRALFLATLARLAHLTLIQIGRAKTNMDYGLELRRREHALPEAPELFMESANIYEAVWYGDHEATQAALDKLGQNQERLRQHAHE